MGHCYFYWWFSMSLRRVSGYPQYLILKQIRLLDHSRDRLFYFVLVSTSSLINKSELTSEPYHESLLHSTCYVVPFFFLMEELSIVWAPTLNLEWDSSTLPTCHLRAQFYQIFQCLVVHFLSRHMEKHRTFPHLLFFLGKTYFVHMAVMDNWEDVPVKL